jgi:sugar-specific transcriptional regulator TrmB
MDINQTFQNLGLNQKQTAIYLAVLELGQASVGQIAKKSAVKRPTCYVVFDELEKKGFVSKLVKKDTTLYMAEHPKKLLTEAELQVKELKTIIPQLESLFRKDDEKPRVAVYEGKEQLDIAYDESFAVSGEVLYMSTLKLSQEVFQKTFRKMDLINLSENYRMRELVDESDEGRKYMEKVKGPFRDVRMIPKEFLPFEVDIGIFGNKVLVTSLKQEYFTVSMQSPEINKAFRQLFEAMWQLSKN